MCNVLLARLFLLASLLRTSLSAPNPKVRVKFANFIRMTHQSPELTTAVIRANKTEITRIPSLEVSEYMEIPNGNYSMLVCSVMNTDFRINLNTKKSNLLTVYFYWNSQIVITQLEDLENPKSKFDSISSLSSVVFHYFNNTMWRLVLINPFNKYYYPKTCQMLAPSCKLKYPRKIIANISYYIDNSFSKKKIAIFNPENPETPVKILQDIKFESFGVYTVFVLMDGMSDHVTISTDKAPEDVTLPLVFLAAYIGVWGVFRQISMYKLHSRGKKKFYVVKSIRVHTKEENELMLLSDELHFVDTIRGIAVLLIIFVRNGGGGYRFMTESLWDGFSLGDFPKFLLSWIMGFCIPLSLSKKVTLRKFEVVKGMALKCCLMMVLGKID